MDKNIYMHTQMIDNKCSPLQHSPIKFKLNKVLSLQRIYPLSASGLYPESSSGGGGEEAMMEITRQAPNKTTTMAVKLTRRASGPYFARPAASRKVSFSRKPSRAVVKASTYTIAPNSRCQGRDAARTSSGAPGNQNATNPNIH